MATTVNIDEMLGFLNDQKETIIPIKRLELIEVYSEIAQLRAKKQELEAALELMVLEFDVGIGNYETEAEAIAKARIALGTAVTEDKQ